MPEATLRTPTGSRDEGGERSPISSPAEDEVKLRSRKQARLATVILLILICGAASLGAFVFRQQVLAGAEWLKKLPRAEGAALYVSLLTVWVVCLFPTVIVEVAAGYVFGFVFATACSTAGKTLGSAVSYAIGRTCSDAVRRRVMPAAGEPDHAFVRGLETAMRVEPFKTTLALRMAYVPEAVQNYVPAVLQVPPLPFALATFIGSFLYALLWARLGAQLGSAAAIASAPEKLTPERITFFALGLAGLIGLFGLVYWNTKKTIARFAHLEPLSPQDLSRVVV